MHSKHTRYELIRRLKKHRTSVSTAAAQLGVPPSTAYRWVRTAANGRIDPTSHETLLASSRPTFVELVPTSRVESPLVVRVGAAEIDVRAGFDAALLRSVFEALQGGGA